MILEYIYNNHISSCTLTKQRIAKYGHYRSYGSILMVERLFEIFFMSIERLIEDTFISYAIGELSITGLNPGRKISLNDKADIISLISAAKDYPDWTRWDYIIDVSNLIFSTSPFNVLKHYITSLNELKTIRNALAHMSGSSQDKFVSLVRKKLNYYPSSFTVKDFLLCHVSGTRSQIYFQEYIDISVSIAQSICK